MNKRLRKKKCVGEFKEFGFELFADLRSGISDDDIEAFVDRLIVVVEVRKLAFGGGGGRDGKFEGSWDAAAPPRTTALRWPPSSRATTPWFVTRYWSFETCGTGGTSGMSFFSKLKAAFSGPATFSTTAAPAPVARGPSWRASDAHGLHAARFGRGSAAHPRLAYGRDPGRQHEHPAKRLADADDLRLFGASARHRDRWLPLEGGDFAAEVDELLQKVLSRFATGGGLKLTVLVCLEGGGDEGGLARVGPVGGHRPQAARWR
jgi:hypothetical protein